MFTGLPDDSEIPQVYLTPSSSAPTRSGYPQDRSTIRRPSPHPVNYSSLKTSPSPAPMSPLRNFPDISSVVQDLRCAVSSSSPNHICDEVSPPLPAPRRHHLRTSPASSLVHFMGMKELRLGAKLELRVHIPSPGCVLFHPASSPY